MFGVMLVVLLLLCGLVEGQPATEPGDASECLFKMEGPVNGIFQSLYGSTQYNSRPVWHLVDPATGDAAVTNPVYMFWNAAGKVWNIASSVDETVPVYGYAEQSEAIICPVDSAPYKTYSGSGFTETGFIYQLLGDFDATCSPVTGSIVSTDTPVDAGGREATVSACARLPNYSNVVAIQLKEGKCMSSVDPNASVDTTDLTTTMCVRRCNLLTGFISGYKQTSAYSLPVPAGDNTSPLECAAAVFGASSSNNGADYRSAATCNGGSGMRTTNTRLDALARSCFVGDGANLTVAGALDTKPLPSPATSPGHTTTTTTTTTTTASGAFTVKVFGGGLTMLVLIIAMHY